MIRDDFAPSRSDVDVLVEFLPDAHPGLKFFGHSDELVKLLGRRVDLHTPGFISHHFREQVLRDAVTIYEQA